MASQGPGSPEDEYEYESLRVRPYVPGPDPGEPGGEPAPLPRALRDADQEAAAADVDFIDLGTVSSADRLPVPVSRASREVEPYIPVGAAGTAAAAPAGRARRRRAAGPRRAAVIAGAAGAAVVLAVGAVLLTAHLTRVPDRTEAVPDRGASEPALELPPSARPTAAASPSASASPSERPSTLASGKGLSSATAYYPGVTATPSASHAPASAPASVSAPPTAATSKPPTSAPPAAPATLRPGDSGPEVVELQDRLRKAGLYYRDSDGQYDQGVSRAVSRFQYFHHVTGDPDGVYGPNTRKALEEATA
ncbi:peptidoglycan-binding domain-containing protein [Streptomyces sp. NPDC088354]|uniref:peptidoglycan-binding domain-containing protein n=1 Tax=unclassified Streptomyces TaxID=2593676 RepID=UPI0029BC7B1E|nr:peptidoglycan-binding domain-containing protein [Streptomyces sp. MI02-7b]MDX3075644.1 peptidoglycan-binding domain-containing protein [Streptomyces sp. MI02-7b]